MINVGWSRESAGEMRWCVSLEEEREEGVFYDR